MYFNSTLVFGSHSVYHLIKGIVGPSSKGTFLWTRKTSRPSSISYGKARGSWESTPPLTSGTSLGDPNQVGSVRRFRARFTVFQLFISYLKYHVGIAVKTRSTSPGHYTVPSTPSLKIGKLRRHSMFSFLTMRILSIPILRIAAWDAKPQSPEVVTMRKE